MWLAATNGNSKQKKGEASCTCSDPRGSSTMAKQGAADASQKPIDPSSLSITEALAGTFVATVFEFVPRRDCKGLHAHGVRGGASKTKSVGAPAIGIRGGHEQGADLAPRPHRLTHLRQVAGGL